MEKKKLEVVAKGQKLSAPVKAAPAVGMTNLGCGGPDQCVAFPHIDKR